MNKDELIKLVYEEFPDFQFAAVELVRKGWDHDVLILNEKYVFRFAKDGLDKSSFQREMRFLADLGNISNLPAPRYRWISKNGNFGGYEIVQGKALLPEAYEKFSDEKKLKFNNEIARFLTLLHGIPLEKAEGYGFAPFTSWEGEMRERQRWYRSQFKQLIAPKLSAEQLNFIEKFARDFYYSDYAIRPVLAHYDLSHDHIIVQAQDISGIIDFGDLRIGDPAQEFAGLFDYSKILPSQIYEKYDGPKDSQFMRRARQHYIHRWVYLHQDALVRRKDDALWNEAQRRLNDIIRSERSF
jgi:aminoglycoside 2''-phosphotransferase